MAPRAPTAVRHLILDRDGVLNREGDEPIRSPSEWVWERGALDGLRAAAAHGVVISVVTNQSAVAAGRVRPDDLASLHDWLRRQLGSFGLDVAGVFACPHGADDGCACRKPGTDLLRLALDASSVEPAATVVIGDDLRDLAAAEAMGLRSALVRTGKGRQVEARAPVGTVVYEDLADATRRLLPMAPERAAPPSRHLTSILGTLDDHLAVVSAGRDLVAHDAARLAEAALHVSNAGGTIFAAGNGGSAADAQHFVAELVGRFGSERPPVRAIALGTDAPTATAISNDLGFQRVFARQIEALATPGDLLLALSTSGASPNVIEAASTARSLGCTVACVTGEDGGALAGIGHIVIRVPSRSTQRIQEVTGVLLHAVAEVLDAESTK